MPWRIWLVVAPVLLLIGAGSSYFVWQQNLEHALISARAAQSAKSHTLAQRWANLYLRRFPDHQEAQRISVHAQARAAQSDEELKTAIRAFGKLPTLEATDLVLRAGCNIRLNQVDRALPDLMEALKTDTSSELYRSLIVTFRLAGRNEEALRYALKLSEDPQERGIAYAFIADLYHDLLEWNKSTEYFALALKENPELKGLPMNNGVLYSNQARCWNNLTRGDKAIEMINKIGDISDNPMALTLRAKANEILGKSAEAEQDFKRAMNLQTEVIPNLWLEYGVFLSENNRDQEAIAVLLKGLEHDPKHQLVLNRLIMSYRRLGNTEREQHYQKVLEKLRSELPHK